MAKDIKSAFQLEAGLDANAVAVYEKALSTVAKESFSYVELRTAVRKLLQRGMSQQDALASVMVTAETLGQDRAALLKSAEAHLNRLSGERKKIAEAMDKRLTDGMAQDRARVEAAANKQADLKLKIGALERELIAAEEKERALAEALETACERVEEQGKLLDDAHAAFHREISSDLAAIRAV